MSGGRIEAVNVGERRVLAGSAETTGIVKTPRTGPVWIDAGGLLGDVIVNRRHHGGPDQAVYLYLKSDYDWWAGELGHALEPGTFGENLTVSGLRGDDLAIGDRLAIGDVVLELTWHRTPCATFGRRMGDPRWVKQFARALRPGAYARVIAPGPVEAGMAIAHTPFAGERVGVAEMMSFDGARDIPQAFLRRALATPLRARAREKFEAMLADG